MVRRLISTGEILIHGACAVVLRSKRDRIAIGEWMTALEARAPRNVLIVGQRTSWRGSHGRCYRVARTIGQFQSQLLRRQA